MIQLSRRVPEPILMNMLSYPGPTSNYERQRQFRERNPGYYQRLHAKRRAEVEAFAKTLATAQAMAATRKPLALPEPVETLVIPGMNMIPATPALSPVSVSVGSPQALAA